MSDAEDMDVEGEEDKCSAPFLLSQLKKTVQQYLGKALFFESARFGDSGEAKLDEAAAKCSVEQAQFRVRSARVLAQLNSETYDGEEGPGSARYAFKETLNKLQEFVVEPYIKQVASLDKTVHARLRGQLKAFGDDANRLGHISHKANSLLHFAKVEHDEQQIGVVSRYGVDSLCLPSKLYKLSLELGYDFMNELEDESDKKIYLTYGSYVLLEIGYGDEQVTLTATLTNDKEEELKITDEGNDILASFMERDVGNNYQLLRSKLRALIRRSDLEIQLKAGSVNELCKDIRAVLEAQDGCEFVRVAQGMQVTLPKLDTCVPLDTSYYDHPGKYPVIGSVSRTQGKNEQQRIIAGLALRHGIPDKSDSLPWQEKTALIVTLEPPVEMGRETADKLMELVGPSQGTSGDIDKEKEGSAIALLLSKQGREPVSADILKAPPKISSQLTFCTQSDGEGAVIKLAVPNGNDAEELPTFNYSTILQQIVLAVNQHDILPKIISVIAQQRRFNALVSSCVFHPLIRFESSKVANARKEKSADDADVNKKKTKKRVLLCAARREFLKKLKKAEALESEDFDDGDETSVLGMDDDKIDHDSLESRAVHLKLDAPSSITVCENDENKLSINVSEDGGNITVEPKVVDGKDIETLLNKTNCVPIALFYALQLKKV
uniref:Mediator of RNA polymerase II transcription subunit 1 n=1 Tax=Mucochytrium quahogii TaxID=96639 RepID=A0A7S2S345_9STRA|mmetsp:Transcript_12578/g.22837  ORF Transcript_12578/g.22837 Transcript_12578/m.22837 type:complete len:664 (+) Transcript_12578:216-2207(+)|eukprot:CAMPEP_0203756274 /NCGR_PEP_ID=MMETSP0098-20131031/9574_1 /ASSEMBLY_ACC=CAM_ASM_000208 /TAXON_ID=96639 /ORGANISM=" , Strain NY0313808BC1" /LENGTH=663 /DNA_ID=CAMNT_0050648077 /DNA_START=117 /DNA_END=2108 /DNA_ORIENTATION=-